MILPVSVKIGEDTTALGPGEDTAALLTLVTTGLMNPRGNPHQPPSYGSPPLYQYPYPHTYGNYQLTPTHAQAYAMTPPTQQLYSSQGDMFYHQQYYQFAPTSSVPHYYVPHNISMNYSNVPNPNNTYGQYTNNKPVKFDSSNRYNNSNNSNKIVEAKIYYCEVCDKEMNSLSAYDAHCATHESCVVNGCKFKASKRVVQAHFHSAHGQYQGSGYKTIDVEGQKFCVLMGTDTKEVEQWRNERRKKFPTAIKQILRDGMKDQVLEAGGILPASDSNLGKRAKITHENNQRKKNNKVYGSKLDDMAPQKALIIDGRLDVNDKVEVVVDPDDINGHSPIKTCSYFVKGKCRRGSKCIYLHDSSLKTAVSLDDNDRDIRPKSNNKLIVPKPLVGGERGTLLKKLLEDDIMAEDNIILQCLRYFVKNDYFDNIV